MLNSQSLPPRQRQVLAHVVDGLSNREIGARMGIGINTVKVHVVKLLDVTGARNRVELAVLAAREQERRAG